MPFSTAEERAERRHLREWGSKYEDLLPQFDNQDFIVIKYPSREEIEKERIVEAYELQQLKEQFKKRI